jgi:hypothetical protein
MWRLRVGGYLYNLESKEFTRKLASIKHLAAAGALG